MCVRVCVYMCTHMRAYIYAYIGSNPLLTQTQDWQRDR